MLPHSACQSPSPSYPPVFGRMKKKIKAAVNGVRQDEVITELSTYFIEKEMSKTMKLLGTGEMPAGKKKGTPKYAAH